ncbi:hypothetical protein NMY22_g13984 [Coprinellus aureogranulatus]|nr:hypothetical protein NMY22_g13984 [Coprinellus aureogranulatus]
MSSLTLIDSIAGTWCRLGHTSQVQLLVRIHQVRGHHLAELNLFGVKPPEPELSRYGVTNRDLDSEIALGPRILLHFATEGKKTINLLNISLCTQIYFGAVGHPHPLPQSPSTPPILKQRIVLSSPLLARMLTARQWASTTSCSTPYPSDIAKSIDTPTFHVNGDNVEAVNFVCQLATDYRAKWKKDVIIDIEPKQARNADTDEVEELDLRSIGVEPAVLEMAGGGEGRGSEVVAGRSAGQRLAIFEISLA